MNAQSFFQEALADFANEVAWGGALRHLADLGYTAKQIRSRLDFPVSYEKVRRAVWQRLAETEVILPEEPGRSRHKNTAAYVREYDQFGKASFRRVSGEELVGEESVLWKERHLGAEGEVAPVTLAALLRQKVEENGQKNSYMSCDFGILEREAPEAFARALSALEERQREYVEGLPWEGKRCYHRLDSRMSGILYRLYRAECYRGECFFVKSAEKLVI